MIEILEEKKNNSNLPSGMRLHNMITKLILESPYIYMIYINWKMMYIMLECEQQQQFTLKTQKSKLL